MAYIMSPRKNARLGVPVTPDTDEIASALARQTGTRIAPSGATWENRLGLSTQVPAKPVYLTDGRSRSVRVGNLTLVVKHVAPKDFPVGSQVSATVFQALRYLGKDAVNPQNCGQNSSQPFTAASCDATEGCSLHDRLDCGNGEADCRCQGGDSGKWMMWHECRHGIEPICLRQLPNGERSTSS